MRALLAAALGLGLAGAAATAGPPAPCPVFFTDVAPTAGLRFTHVRGATPAHQLPETMGSGIT